jgi:o-succinylbenzoate synthase
LLINNQYQFQFEPYRRYFKIPLRTSHGLWQVREGIIITLKDNQGKIGKGEIAPIPWFGSETIEDAHQFCQQQGHTIADETIINISDRLPCCQFALESALINLNQKSSNNLEQQFLYAYLLPTGKQVLEQDYLLEKYKTSTPTFKWKIAVTETKTEIAIAKKLLAKLSLNARLRLDANGGLTLKDAHQWLEFAANYPAIEFIEQPLPPSQFTEMTLLQSIYPTPLALDESVANISQLQDCYHRGWRSIFVLKVAISGFPSRLRSFCQQNPLDLVFSSVFETAIGRQMALQLALELGNRDRAVGFGVQHWFSDRF